MWLAYGDKVKPIFSVIVINTLVFSYGMYRTGWVFLFLLQWIFANANQGFIFGRYDRIWRYLDFINSAFLAWYLYNPSYSVYIPFTLIVFLWHFFSKDMNTFIFRVNVWHLYCFYLFHVLTK